MGISDYFKSVESMTAEEVRALMNRLNPDDYNLIDVRQPKEYERGHISGARLIPVGELRERMHELDPGKPTVAY